MAKKDFFDEEVRKAESGTISYMDGFRFGFGFFIAWLLGLLVVSGLAVGIARLLHIS